MKKLILSLLAATYITAIACSPAQKQAIFSGIGDVTICVLEHEGETPEEIAAHCTGAAVADVIKILKAHNAAMAKRQCPDAGNPIHDAGAMHDAPNYGPGK